MTRLIFRGETTRGETPRAGDGLVAKCYQPAHSRLQAMPLKVEQCDYGTRCSQPFKKGGV